MKNFEMYLLILVALIMAPAALLIPGSHRSVEAKKICAYSDVNGGLKITLRMFKDDCGRYPTQAEGLEVLIQPPADGSLKGWKGPYFDPPEVPKDPWGHEYVYGFPAIKSTNDYDLYSLGKNGRGNDADDIGNWQVGESAR